MGSLQSQYSNAELRVGDWICPNKNCNEHNFNVRYHCRKCGTPNTQSAYNIFTGGDWVCLNCNGYNFKIRDHCRKCGTSKNGINPNPNSNPNPNPNSNPNLNLNPTPNLNTDTTDDNVCIICFDNPKMYAITKCGHFCYCMQCGFNKSITNCPICRVKYNPNTDLLKIIDV